MRETLLLERARKDLKRCVKMLSESSIEMTEEYSLFLESVNKTISEIGIATDNYKYINYNFRETIRMEKQEYELVKSSVQEVLSDMQWFENQVFLKSRRSEYVRKRQFLCYILRNVYHFSFQNIGEAMNCDHSTVIHHVRCMSDYITIGDKITLGMLNAYTKAQSLNEAKHGQVAE